MTKFSYSEIKAAYTAVQAARVSYLPTFSKLEKNVDEFTATSDLTGVGWNAAKEALSPYTVVSKALYNYHCDFGETSAAFLASFESEVGETTKVLDTEELKDLQDKLNRIQKEKTNLMEDIAKNVLNGIIGTTGVSMFYKNFQIDQTQKKVDLLEKYETFEASHVNDFAELIAVGLEIEKALNDLGKSKSFDKKTGMYTYVDCTGKDWYKSISEYNDNSPAQRIEIVKTDEYGYGLRVYIDGQYSKQASDNLMYAQSQEYMKEMGTTTVTMTGEFIGAYDIYRLLTGKDPVTGDKANRLEAGLWTMLLLLPQAKMVDAAKELKAGNKVLKGANLTEKELKLLSKAGYFDDVEKLGKIEKVSEAADDINKIPEIEVEFNRNPKHDATEFARQLENQQKGMNELTVQEYLDNRTRYLAEGRAIEGNAAQQAAREKVLSNKIEELFGQGMSWESAEKEATSWMDSQAALHNPDQIAGGNASIIGGMGDKGINSSLGAQWKYRIDTVDEQIREMAKNMTPEQLKNTYLNVKLTH